MMADGDIPAARGIGGIALSTGAMAALITLLTGAICMALEPFAPWLVKFPDAWALPAAEWIGVGLTWFLDVIKPAMRVISGILASPSSSS